MHEPVDGRLQAFLPLMAATTTGSVPVEPVRYLAVWRLPLGQGMEAVGRPRAPSQGIGHGGHSGAYVYVPAFSLARMVVENVGVRLTQRQPVLGAAAVPWSGGRPGSARLFSPVLLGRREARLLGEFVCLGLAVREGRDENAVARAPDMGPEELVYIPAVSDRRCVHDADWRLLLREFDV